MLSSKSPLAPGARVVIRDAEWLIRRVEPTSTGSLALNLVGLSELVRDKDARVLAEAEDNIEVLDPALTRLVSDPSPGYSASRLYIEGLLRQTPPTDDGIHIGHKGAMDPVPYQLDPAAKSLKQPRQRILIADAVGLGKTIECGVLLSELIRRGRGKRILVVAVKSMLTQFQKELWSRFAIPLTRLDSVGLQRVRNRIPTNHNPFHYFDRSIISVDTLKQDREYGVYLENAWWDIIVIDEAHNVAERGQGASLSQRARLAKLLASRSDTLVMLSATPHDGRAKSFASLMNMLDPTAIANPNNYGPEDIKGLFIRRFKKDIQNQVQTAFKERQIYKISSPATSQEETAFDLLTRITLTCRNGRTGGEHLFRTTLEKALFSSPAACLETIKHRLDKLSGARQDADPADIASLQRLHKAVSQITPATFSKYQHLVRQLTDPQSPFYWTGKHKTDRLVIFTERIATLEFLRTHLPKALNLKARQVQIMKGDLGDVELQTIVDDFGREESPIRLLLATDVASEGINLHYLSHRMIHFDIPWSLMVFQQRNGRIDRYGQQEAPQITYLMTASENPSIKGDMRILELLINKDDEAVRSIGDPSAFMGVYDIAAEEEITARAMESGTGEADFSATLEKNIAKGFDPLAILQGTAPAPNAKPKQVAPSDLPSIFADDFSYVHTALQSLRREEPVHFEVDRDKRLMELTAPDDLLYRFRMFPREIMPDNKVFVLSDDKDLMAGEIARSRKDEKSWPKVHYLWELNPVVQWINDKVLTGFRRHEAPVVTLQHALAPKECIYLLSGLIPNKKGHPLIHHWFGVRTLHGVFDTMLELPQVLERTGIKSKNIPNPGQIDVPDAVQELLPQVVAKARAYMTVRRDEFHARIMPELERHKRNLAHLRNKHGQEIQLHFQGMHLSETLKQSREQERLREMDTIFKDYERWIDLTMNVEDNPYIKVVTVFMGREG